MNYPRSSVLCGLLFVQIVSAQSNPSQPSDAVIRVNVDLVQVDAVVTDSNGRHVSDLSASEFQIFEDGKPETITHFSYVKGTAPSSPSTAASGNPRSSPGSLTAIPPFIDHPLTPRQVHRTVVLIADDLGLSPDDIVAVRAAMKSFVDHQMEPDDLVSIMTTSGGMGVMQQVTNDRRQLYAAIDRIHWSPARTGLTWYEPANIGDAAREYETEVRHRLNAVRSPLKVIGTFATLQYAIQGLHEMPGRKAIAFFSDGFVESPGALIELANRASVVIYAFDPRGLASFFLSAVDVCASCAGAAGPAKIRRLEGAREVEYRNSQAGLDDLARGTGGLFFHDRNDLGNALSSAVEDISSYYLIGYQPHREDFDLVHGAPRFHRIEVRVLRPGLNVRFRNGFMGKPDSDSTREPQISVREELRKALFSPFAAQGLNVHLSAFYLPLSGKQRKAAHTAALLRTMLAIDVHDLKLAKLDFEIVAALYGPDNKVVASNNKNFTTTMTPEQTNQLAASGLLYGLDTVVPKPGPYQLRVAVWDAATQRVGSASRFIEIPDFNAPGLSLSSVMLYDSDTARNEKLTREGIVGAGSAVTRTFERGAALTYDYAVINALLDPVTTRPRLDVQVRLFRGLEQIFQGTLIRLPAGESGSGEPIQAKGEIKLPSTLPPGEYSAGFTVYDRLRKQTHQPTTQWVDFTLVP